VYLIGGDYMYRLVGGAVAMAGMLVVGGMNSIDRSTNYVKTVGEVYSIDRTCGFNTTHSVGGKVTKVERTKKRCNSTNEFAKIRANPDNPGMRVDGTATMYVTYASPIDQSQLSGTLKFDGSDREFYAINAHDKITILVSKADPSQIKL
jgi:hypothetical protein